MKKIILILSVCASSAFSATPSFGPGGQWTSGTFTTPTISGTITGNFTRSGTTTGGTISDLTLTGTTTGGTFAAATLTGTTSASTLNVTVLTNVSGNATLGDASGDTLTINAGTITAPSGTATGSTNLANVGALDSRYGVPSRAVLLADSGTYASTTLADISGLTLVVTSGTYAVRSYLGLTLTTVADGSKGRLQFSGSSSSANGFTEYYSAAATTAINATMNLNQTGGSILAQVAYPGRSMTIVSTGLIVVATTGTLSLQMATNAAPSGSVKAQAGSFIEAIKY